MSVRYLCAGGSRLCVTYVQVSWCLFVTCVQVGHVCVLPVCVSR